MKLHVPSIDADLVAAFCTKISPGEKPFYVNVCPVKGALPRECFNNVQQEIAKNGGRIEYGWAIWLCDNVFIEAEFHAVLKNVDNMYIDAFLSG